MSQKTPISLMNELAKANNLEPEYKVLEETGPAHKKMFTVELRLGDVGRWQDAGNSIKQAKHAAASQGLENCGLCLPEKSISKPPVNLTPTVELNGLAMKLGKPTQYRDLPPKPLPSHAHGQFPGQSPRHMNPGFRGNMSNMQHQNFNQMSYGMQQRPYNHYNSMYYPRQPPRMMRVSLTVGDQEFIGEGRDKQQARHNAAKKASEALRIELKQQLKSGDKGTTGSLIDQATPAPDDGPSQSEQDVKSEISLVYEEATRRKLLVDFSDVNNVGPAHMKKFVVRATVGEFVIEGEGMRKKDAKKDAAIKMLEELKKLAPLSETEMKRQKNGHFVKRNGPKRTKPKPKSDLDPTMNPISILGQILQGRHEPAPVYSLVEERGHLTEKKFVLQVVVGKHQATGEGSNKKTAKKNAAEAMLVLMGFRPTKEEKLNQQTSQNGTSGTVEQKNGRQLKPGLLPMVPELAKQFGCPVVNPAVPIKEDEHEPLQPAMLNRAPGAPVASQMMQPPGAQLSKVQALLQVAESKGMLVHISHYPKDVQGTTEFISLVNISSVPPITCCGSGFSPEAAEEDAASNALIALIPIPVKHEALSQDQLSTGKVPIAVQDVSDPVVMINKE